MYLALTEPRSSARVNGNRTDDYQVNSDLLVQADGLAVLGDADGCASLVDGARREHLGLQHGEEPCP